MSIRKDEWGQRECHRHVDVIQFLRPYLNSYAQRSERHKLTKLFHRMCWNCAGSTKMCRAHAGGTVERDRAVWSQTGKLQKSKTVGSPACLGPVRADGGKQERRKRAVAALWLRLITIFWGTIFLQIEMSNWKGWSDTYSYAHHFQFSSLFWADLSFHLVPFFLSLKDV